ncbi:rolling circle replication-associated protein [Rubellicoccus peritrichatus]|uniref:Replication-associated protein ORF2/G2P domain-containing protein n=1 Tax=Rubellicoccus peritrichatus TaxID=3080537 RepID=A0AAQ3QW71_9BACT|nr:hypothetical protein [Puniceicoccus sp. CR14]WOO42363.1 hypothetical protein RZN69_04625 [Puniceicoccus sp. CR14]
MNTDPCFSLPRPKPNFDEAQGGAQPKASNTLSRVVKIDGLAEARDKMRNSEGGKEQICTLGPFYPESWFHPIGALKLKKKLMAKLPDVSGCLFLTFTVNPNEYANPESAYNISRQKLRKLFYSLRNGVNWNGKHFKLNSPYFVKTEFHKNGFAHFHVVFLTKRFLPGILLNQLWKLGRTNVKRISNKDFHYLLKYVVKNNDLPEWVKNRNRIRIIQSSHGFYSKLAEIAKRNLIPKVFPRKRRKKNTIGERIEIWRHKAVFRKGKRAWTVNLSKPFFEILSEVILPLAHADQYLGEWTIQILNIGEIEKWLKNQQMTTMNSVFPNPVHTSRASPYHQPAVC